MKLNCKYCSRHLGEAEVIIAELICSNSSCKATNQYTHLTNDLSKMYTHKFTKPEKQPKENKK